MDTNLDANTSLAKELAVDFAKSVVISAATTAGMVVGMAAVGRVLQIKKSRRDKKDAKNTTPTEQ